MLPVSPQDNRLALLHLQVNSLLSDDITPEITRLLDATGELFAQMSDLMTGYDALIGRLDPSRWYIPEPPVPADCCHPPGSLQVADNVIVTPGGYKIEALDQFEWRISSPDGKTWTRFWGDPHADESDRTDHTKTAWDFKHDSTFMLPDGTKINVDTESWGDSGMTVTKRLEIISGNDLVIISDIDNGKGGIGTIRPDGLAHENKFFGEDVRQRIDVFAMGPEADDWSFEGREIVGSRDGGETFITGGMLAPLVERTNKYGGPDGWSMAVFDAVLRHQTNSWQPFAMSYNKPSSMEGSHRRGHDPAARGHHYHERDSHVDSLADAFSTLGKMFTALSRITKLNDQLVVQRARPFQV